MKKIKFKFIKSIAVRDINSIEEILKDTRLCRILWIEFLTNPESIYDAVSYLENDIIKNNLTKALSWYLAFKWIFKENKPLEEIKEKVNLKPFQIRGETYRKDRRTFIKGIIYARLC